MDHAALAERAHQNLLEANDRCARQVPGAVVDRTNGIALFVTGLPVRLFNQLTIEDDRADARSITAAVAVLRASGVPYVAGLRVGRDERHANVLRDLGLVSTSHDPWRSGMALHPLVDRAEVETPDDLEIRQVRDAQGVRHHVSAAAAGFAVTPEVMAAIITERLARLPDVSLYVGYADGIAVTTGLGIRTGDTIGVYNIATVPDVRRRGFAAAMTARVVRDGLLAGCDVAILQPSAMGLPVYERLGFRTVIDYDGFVEQEDAAAA